MYKLLLIVAIAGTLAAEISLYSIVLAPYAINRWWVIEDVSFITLVAHTVIAGAGSLAIGYYSRSMWIPVALHVVFAVLMAVVLRSGAAIMQGFTFPAAIISAGMFGWIGERIRYLSAK